MVWPSWETYKACGCQLPKGSRRIAPVTALLSRCVQVTTLLTLVPFASLLPQTGRVDGTVRNSQTLEPVHNARVSLVGTSMFSMTNPDGGYVISSVPVGVYQIRVQAIGFRSVTYADQRVPGGIGIQLNVDLDPTSERGDLETIQSSPRGALQSGFGAGGSVGIDGLGGTDNRAIQKSISFDFFLRYGTRSGLFVHGGALVGKHGFEQVPDDHSFVAVYVEPRFVVLRVSPTWAPFVAGRVARVWETVPTPAGRLAASGYSVGGGGGVLLRLDRQITLEGNVSIGSVTFGDYGFQGGAGWHGCLNGLQGGTPLPESVLQCSGSAGRPINLCYPPFAPLGTISGDCSPPEIPFANSGRTATWFRVGLGLSLSFTTR